MLEWLDRQSHDCLPWMGRVSQELNRFRQMKKQHNASGRGQAQGEMTCGQGATLPLGSDNGDLTDQVNSAKMKTATSYATLMRQEGCLGRMCFYAVIQRQEVWSFIKPQAMLPFVTRTG